MFDFVGYVRDMGVVVKIIPGYAGELIRLEVWDPDSKFCEAYVITDREARSCGDLNTYTGQVLDMMVARIGSKKAQLYANRLGAKHRQDVEDFFREA